MRPESNIASFYEGRSVFLTGVSGFLGKAVCEKILRSCPNVNKVYVLLRPRRNMDVKTRLRTVFLSPLFDRLKKENPAALEKVCAIEGDITLTNLGISEEDRNKLKEEVSIVLHSAASVKFNEPLKDALNINYRGTERIFSLCKEMSQLVSFIHVSTAYSNCDREHVPESVICPDITAEGVEEMSDEDALKVTPFLIGNKPNTYTYTKALAENLLNVEGKKSDVPIAIVRPSIIGASWKEPQPGYIDSMCGVTGCMAATGKGFLTCMIGDGSKIGDIIPLDVTANLIIAAAYELATSKKSATPNDNIPVYNCCSGPTNPLKFDQIWEYSKPAYEATPYNDVLRYPSFSYKKSLLVFHILNFIFTFIPCAVMDIVALCTGKKVKMVRAYRKLITSVTVYEFFTKNEWSFGSGNVQKLQEKLSKTDQEIFFTNVQEMNWREYITNYVKGIKQWIFKEDLQDLEEAKGRMMRMYYIHRLFYIGVFAALWSYILKPIVKNRILF